MSSLYTQFSSTLHFLVPSFLISGCLTFSLAVVSFLHFRLISLLWACMYINRDLSSCQMCWRHITVPPPLCVCR